tara:strand:- start:1975 stop:2136 length:162 start_codon:yes stop_codon:yes gene_type:complete
MKFTIMPDQFNNKQQKYEAQRREETREPVQLEFDFDTYQGGVENFANYKNLKK